MIVHKSMKTLFTPPIALLVPNLLFCIQPNRATELFDKCLHRSNVICYRITKITKFVPINKPGRHR